ncbi:hypothetical protein PGRAN_13718 [Listeria grandensis FSL F6-0971]|uniref:DUF393 domain-containing protein n=1 Tax=Listeria grandensis FSL F6-0971 TaxID=1265819 RepID=W7B3T1_9LIST|nr:DUF393 domain-containing protein [Listeria grandensis]EUJ21964.1 hypothetical protein PGRAN_13718 [Listeria grandensis FSL F6-0971]
MKDIVLYDENCRFCKATKRLFEKLDWMKVIEWKPLQETQDTGFTQEELLREIHLITPTGSAKKGFFAIRRMLLRFPLTGLIGLIMYIPIFKPAGRLGYRVVADNRTCDIRKKGRGCNS